MSIKRYVRKQMHKPSSGWEMRLLVLAGIVALIWLAAGQDRPVTPAKTHKAEPPTPTIEEEQAVPIAVADGVVSVVKALPNARIYSSLLLSTGIGAEMDAGGTYTIFAPTDTAFTALPSGMLAGMSFVALRALVAYHVVPNRVIDADAVVSGSVQSFSGDPLNFTGRDGGPPLVGSATIVEQHDASNGVVYLIDGVLIPPQTR